MPSYLSMPQVICVQTMTVEVCVFIFLATTLVSLFNDTIIIIIRYSPLQGANPELKILNTEILR